MSWLFPSGSHSIGASNEYSGLISFRIDWQFDLLAVPRDSQEFSPAPQFERLADLNLLTLRFLILDLMEVSLLPSIFPLVLPMCFMSRAC